MNLHPVTTDPPPQVEPFRNDRGGISMRIYGLFEDVYEFGNYATIEAVREVCETNQFEIIEQKKENQSNDTNQEPDLHHD